MRILFATCLFLAAYTAAHGAALLTFSGGNGAPLTLTLNRSISYTIISSGTLHLFDFESVGNVLPAAFGGTDTITFSVNGGTDEAITAISSDESGGQIAPTDLILGGDLSPTVNAGDVVTLNPGTFTTFSAVSAPPPPNGNYSTFICNGTGAAITAVPEPSDGTMLVAGAIIGLFVARPRRIYAST
jgi:hypothetical protein